MPRKPKKPKPVIVPDPLEDAKMSEEELEAEEAPPELAPTDAEKAPPPKLPDAPPPPRPPQYKVVRQITLSWGGQFITLREGSVVSEASHGPGSVDKMREAGVALEEV